jgi:hypothetical protein
LNASTCALSVGFPGRLKSRVTWFQYAQWSRAFDVNSVPLSTEICCGSFRSRPAFVRIPATSSPRKLILASSATHSRVCTSTTVRIRTVRPPESTSCTKSIAHRWSGPLSVGRFSRRATLLRRFGFFRRNVSRSSEYSR